MTEKFIEDFRNLTSLTDVIYYYHVTDANPEDILKDGLYLVGNDICETAIVIPEEFRIDPVKYVNNEQLRMNYRRNLSVIIIGIFEDKVDDLLQEAKNIPAEWNSIEEPKYFVSPSNIIGYIDASDMELIINEIADIDYYYHM